MTLDFLLKTIGQIAINNKLVNYYAAGGSIYELNALDIKDYSLIYVSPTGNHETTGNYTSYQLTLFYIDRLTDDSSNEVQIFSTGVEVIKDLVRKIGDLSDVLSVSNQYIIQNFTETEKMSDRCAGAYATVSVTVMENYSC